MLSEVHRPILHRAGAAAAALAWLAKRGGHRVTYTDAAGFAVIEDAGCAAYLSFDSDYSLTGFESWNPTWPANAYHGTPRSMGQGLWPGRP